MKKIVSGMLMAAACVIALASLGFLQTVRALECLYMVREDIWGF